MKSTQQGYTPGWSRYSTGPSHDTIWGINSATKGRLMAGAFIGDVTGTTGSIGTAELADGAVTSAKLSTGAAWGSDVSGAIETNSTADTVLGISGVSLLTKATTAALALTIPAPTNGVRKAIVCDSVGSGLAFTLTCATTTVAFDSTGDKTLTFSAINDSVTMIGSGTSRWVVTANVSVTYS